MLDTSDPNFNFTSGDGMLSPSQGQSMASSDSMLGAGTAGGQSMSNLAGVGGAVLGGAALGYDLLRGDQQSAPEAALTNDAAYLGALGNREISQGQGLQTYLEQGTLPPAQQAQLELQRNAAKARIIQGDASRGQNTNPLKNSGLTQDLNSLGLQSEVEKGKLEQQLFQAGNQLITQGNQAIGLEVGIQEKLAAIDAQQSSDTMKAIMSFAGALGSLNWGSIASGVGSAFSSIASGVGAAGTAVAGEVGAAGTAVAGGVEAAGGAVASDAAIETAAEFAPLLLA